MYSNHKRRARQQQRKKKTIILYNFTSYQVIIEYSRFSIEILLLFITKKKNIKEIAFFF